MKVYIGKPVFFITIGLILGVILGFYIAGINKNDNLHEKVSINDNLYPHTRPSFISWDEKLEKTQELIPFKTAVEKHINEGKKLKKAEIVSYYFRDLNNGPWFGVNENEKFSVASLFKVPTLMSYYKWAENNPSILKRKITYNGVQTNKQDLNPLTEPEEILIPHKEYTIENLLERMIIYSDNEAFRMLIEYADVGLIADPYNISEVKIENKNDDYLLSLREYSPFFRSLYNSSYLTREYSEKALILLTKTKFDKGLVAGVPKGIEVAHKFGIRETQDGKKQLHECGIVYYPKYPYTVCIMTRGENINDLASVIKSLSKLTYDNVKTQLN